MCNQDYEFAVIGAGITGQLAAFGLALQGHNVCRIAPAVDLKNDHRTTALLVNSVRFLEDLGLWKNLGEYAEPLKIMRIVDASKRLFRAPQVDFKAVEIGMPVFGYNIKNRYLLEVIEKASHKLSGLKLIKESAKNFKKDGERVLITTVSNKTVNAKYIAAADGSSSPVRYWSGINTRQWNYSQAAIVLDFSHEYDHLSTSTEFHTETGPFTQVPLPGKRSALVWVTSPDEIIKITNMEHLELARIIEKRMHGMLGKVTIEGEVKNFSLSGMIAARFSSGSVFLIGEAGHKLPPIIAQGLNLGISDVKALVNFAGNNLKGFPVNITTQYNLARRRDVFTRTAAVDFLNRSLISNLLPAHLIRIAGLQVLSRSITLKKTLMALVCHGVTRF